MALLTARQIVEISNEAMDRKSAARENIGFSNRDAVIEGFHDMDAWIDSEEANAIAALPIVSRNGYTTKQAMIVLRDVITKRIEELL